MVTAEKLKSTAKHSGTFSFSIGIYFTVRE